MIVRIMGDNQYRLDEGHQAEITKLDEDLAAAIQAQDATRFAAMLAQLTTYVRENGTVVPDEEVVPSDLMVPAADMSIAEAQAAIEKDARPHIDLTAETGASAGE